MKKWEDVKREISGITSEEAEVLDTTASLVAKLIIKRKDLGWTQEQLAEAAGLKQSAVARIEGAKTVPRVDSIQKLAQAMGLKLSLVENE